MAEKSKNAQKYTAEQIYFIVGKKKLAELQEIAKKRPLTLEEKMEMDEVKEKLFAKVVRFGMSKAQERMPKYRLAQDAYQDVQQALAVMFFEKLDNYDPRLSTPTTYFLRYFQQVISTYLLEDSQHLTQYDAHNISIVRGAIYKYESQGIRWDEDMLSRETGLSLKVVKNTLYYAANSTYADVNDALDLSTKEPTPEEFYLEQEKKGGIYDALRKCLSPMELRIFLYKVNPEESKSRNYRQVADHFGLSLRDTRQYWNDIIAKLNGDEGLQRYSGCKPKEVKEVVFRQEIVEPDEEMEDLMLDSLSAVKAYS